MTTPNFVNRTLWTADNLDILRGMNAETADLIYLDPPFNSNRNYSAPVGSKAAGAAFKDTWTLSDLDVAWMGLIADEHPAIAHILSSTGVSHGKGMQSYLTMMAVRLLEMRRVLKPTGSIYLHCDPFASHYLKQLMDAIFGIVNFRNEIVWCYASGGVSKRWFGKKHDVILFYTKSSDYHFNPQYRPYSDGTLQRGLTQYKKNLNQDYELREQGAIQNDWWADIKPLLSPTQYERVGYPTQKPLALLDRIILASSNEGDLVLDPFCGCATACVAAENLGRQWIGIDISPKAAELVNLRLSETMGGLFHNRLVTNRMDTPRRTDIDAPKNYRQNKHVLYGSQEGRCAGCRTAFEYRHMEVDHVIPQASGGTDHLENLQLLCGHCNRVKGDRPQEYLVARLREMEIAV